MQICHLQKFSFQNNRLRECVEKVTLGQMNRDLYCRIDINLCPRCVYIKIKKNWWTFYFKTRQLVLIYIFNVLVAKNIWTKENPQIQRNYPFKTIQCSLFPNTHFNNSCSVNKRNSNLIWERGSKFPNFIFFWICILYPIWTLFSMLRSLGNKHSVTYFYMYYFCSHTQGKKRLISPIPTF